MECGGGASHSELGTSRRAFAGEEVAGTTCFEPGIESTVIWPQEWPNRERISLDGGLAFAFLHAT